MHENNFLIHFKLLFISCLILIAVVPYLRNNISGRGGPPSSPGGSSGGYSTYAGGGGRNTSAYF